MRCGVGVASEPGARLVPALLECEHGTTPTEAEEPMMTLSYRQYGEGHPMAKLAEADVLAIRAAHADGLSCYALARQYGVTPPTISNIVSRKSWRHIP